jgi:hypothetical protein
MDGHALVASVPLPRCATTWQSGRLASSGSRIDAMGTASVVSGSMCRMNWETHPVTPDRFEDFADVINPQPSCEPLLVPFSPSEREGHRGARQG